jgi:hypothetical protein
MNRNTWIATLAVAALLFGAGFAVGQHFGTAAEAKAMFDRAVATLKVDQAKAITQFNDKGNKQFRDRDLYVFCFNAKDGKVTAHANPKMLGTDVRSVQVKGDPLGQRLFDAAKPGATATVSYMFPRPGTSNPVPKESFITRIGSQACGVGYYK